MKYIRRIQADRLKASARRAAAAGGDRRDSKSARAGGRGPGFDRSPPREALGRLFEQWVGIEVKWTDTPSAKDIRHLKVFLSEYQRAKQAYLVCRTPRRMKLADHIDAVPWQSVDRLIF